MKKILFTVAFLVSGALFAQGKLAVVDMMVLLRNHSNYDTNKDLLLSTEKNCNKRVENFKKELLRVQEEGKKLAQEYRNPMLSATAKQKIEDNMTRVQQEYMDVQQRLRTEMLNAQREIQDLEALLLKKQTEDIRAKIATLAGNEGVELVMDRNAVLFNAKGIDLTDKVLTSMGVDPAKAINPREAEKNEGK